MSYTAYHEELRTHTIDKLNRALEDLVEDAEAIAGEWNGDESGTLEDRSNLAALVVTLANQLKEAVDDLDSGNF